MIDDSTPRKRCNTCGEMKPATTEYFHAGKGYLYGVNCKCKECYKATYRASHPPRKLCADGGVKRCPGCGQTKPATSEYFYTSRCKSGFKSRCKECSKEYKHFEYIPHAEPAMLTCTICNNAYPATPEYFPRYYRAKNGLRSQCKNCHNTVNLTRYQANPEHQRVLGRNRYLRNREKILARCKKWNDAHREHRSEHGKWYYLINAEWEKERHSQYSRTHRQQCRANLRNYRARKKAVPGTHTAQQIEEQLKRQHYRCYYAACGFSKFPRVKENGEWKYAYEVEHTFPISRVTGMGIPANDIGYLVLACEKCNGSKGNKFPWEWIDGGRLL